MGKKKSSWLSPTKQKALDERLKKEKNKKIVMFVLLGIAILIGISVMTMGIVMASRPYYADIVVEGYGTITIELNGKEAPKTVENFVKLAQSGFYDGTTFNMKGSEGTLCGGRAKDGQAPASIKGEFSKNGVDNGISHMRGTISMNRLVKEDGSSQTDEHYYNSANSEFFIVQKDYLKLDGYFAGFGTVISGMDVVDRIFNEMEADETGAVAKENQPVIKSITIKRSK